MSDDIVKDAKDLLDGIFGKPPEKSMWSDLGSGASPELNLAGISPSNSELPVIFHRDSRASNYEDDAGLIQRRNPPFTIVDINPYKLTDPQFNPSLPLKTLSDKVGYDGDSDVSSVGTTYGQWKSVTLKVQGTFLRINFLPNKINQTQFSNPVSTAINSETWQKEDNTGSINNLTAQPIQFVDPERNGYAFVLVQFDDPNGPLHLAQHGTTFECAFQTIFVTCRMLTPRFSLCIGHNTKVFEDGAQLKINSDPAFGPGLGLWQNPLRHCVPFVATVNTGCQDNGGGALITAPANGTGVAPAPGQTIWTIFVSQASVAANLQPNGVAIGWITGISFTVCASVGVQSFTLVDLMICARSSRTNTITKTFCALSGILASPANTVNSINCQQSFNPPVRFQLLGNNQESLAFVLNISNNGPNFFKAWVHGYTYGPPDISGAGPFLPYIDHNPFPNDARHWMGTI